MNRETWKAQEREYAKMIHGKRIPVTGRSGSDVPDITSFTIVGEVKKSGTGKAVSLKTMKALKGIKKAVKKEQSWKDAVKDAESAVYFVTSMVLTAGMYGIIAKEQADALLRVLGYPTLTETLAESDLPN